MEREAQAEPAAAAGRAAKVALAAKVVLAASLAEPVKPVSPANLENQADLVSPGNPVSRARPVRKQCGRPIRSYSLMRNTESSKSSDPAISASRDVLHKIGVIRGDVARASVDVKNDATFLLADVEIIATCKLANINRTKLENLIHRIFDPRGSTSKSRIAWASPLFPANGFLCRCSQPTTIGEGVLCNSGGSCRPMPSNPMFCILLAPSVVRMWLP